MKKYEDLKTIGFMLIFMLIIPLIGISIIEYLL